MTKGEYLQNNNHKQVLGTDLDIVIQIERISKIFDDTICRAKLVLCLPLLLEDDCKILRRLFTKETVTFVQHTCNKYKEQVSTNEKTRDEADDKIKSFSSSSSEEIQIQDNVLTENIDSKHTIQRNPDPDMCRVINTIFGNSEIRTYCKENLMSQISPAGSKFIDSLKEFYQLICENLKTSPEQEAHKEMELAGLFQQNQRYKHEIEILEQKLQEQTEESEKIILGIKELSKHEMDKIHDIQEQCKQSILKRIDEANKQINWEMKNSEYRREILQSGLKNSQARQEIQLKDNLVNEKEMRIKRYKIESQLVALLEKYDNDMGERQTKLEEMTAAFQEEKEQMQELQEKFDLQEIEYKNLMKEKEAYERQVWEAKLYEIRCKIAARTIQRFYRQYLAICKTKGKKGKGKGKKKK